MSLLAVSLVSLIPQLGVGARSPSQSLAPRWDPGRPTLARTVAPQAVPGHEDALPLLAQDGRAIGTWRLSDAGARVEPSAAGALDAPRLQAWIGSGDGRTLLGAGDPLAPEHALALELHAFRDGRPVARITERLAPGATFTVGEDGALAFAGESLDEPGRPFAEVLDAEGRSLHRHELPPGTAPRDAVLFGERLLLRVAAPPEGRGPASIVALDEGGASTLLELPGAFALAGFPAAGLAFALSREALVCVDVRGGRELWRRAGFLRPAGRHAFELWRSERGDVLALVTAELRELGVPQRGELLLLDLFDGTTVERAPLEVVGPASLVEVRATPAELVVQWSGAREVFTWSP